MESKEHYESLLKLWVISKTLPSSHCNIFLHMNMWDEYVSELQRDAEITFGVS